MTDTMTARRFDPAKDSVIIRFDSKNRLVHMDYVGRPEDCLALDDYREVWCAVLDWLRMHERKVLDDIMATKPSAYYDTSQAAYYDTSQVVEQDVKRTQKRTQVRAEFEQIADRSKIDAILARANAQPTVEPHHHVSRPDVLAFLDALAEWVTCTQPDPSTGMYPMSFVTDGQNLRSHAEGWRASRSGVVT